MWRAAEGKLGVLDSFDVVVIAYVWFLSIERAIEMDSGVRADPVQFAYDMGGRFCEYSLTPGWTVASKPSCPEKKGHEARY